MMAGGGLLELVPVAGAIAAAAFSPGPNNLLVMRAAARGGLRSALPLVAGVICGSWALLAVAVGGAGALFEAAPRARHGLALAGCLYLLWLGARLVASGAVPAAIVRHPDTAVEMAVARSTAAHPAALVAFQFLNPKAWLLVLTACATAPARLGTATLFLWLSGLVLPIATGALLVWALFGTGVARALGRRETPWLDRCLGALLVGSALWLLVETWR